MREITFTPPVRTPDTPIARTLDELMIFGGPMHHGALQVYPLMGTVERHPTYLTLGQALLAGTLEITEVSEGGQVPELVARNRGDRDVLILDGEELVGAKQNRVANTTLLVPAEREVRIPVSCVEQGRWAWRQRYFQASGQTLHARGRRRNIEKVSDSLREGRRYAGDQGEVWDEVRRKAEAMRVASPTGALVDVYQRHEARIEEFQRPLRAMPRMVGGVFVRDDVALGAEVFESEGICQALWPTVVRGYAVDMVEEDRAVPERIRGRIGVVEEFLGDIKVCPVERFPGVGAGSSLRLRSGKVIGAGFLLGERVVHLSAYGRG